MIVDFHAHAFPDALAERAMKHLCAEAPEATAYLDGTVADLLRSMDRSGIDKSVICNIATKPSQFEPIMKWSRQIASERIIPLASIHPEDPLGLEHISQIKAEGIKGIKMHPYYQEFDLDEERMTPIYERLAREGLAVMMHCGYDIAFPPIKRADPEKIVRVKERVPELKLVAAHLGAWKDWDAVEEMLAGRDVYMEISFALELLEPEQARRILLKHPADRLLFGTDSPWTDQGNTLRLLRGLGLGAQREAMLLGGNAMELLGEDV